MQSDLQELEIEIAQERSISDEEINNLMLDEWVKVLAHMWEAIGKPVDEKRLILYCDDFTDVPFSLLDKAVKRAIRNNTYNNVPTIGALWEAVRKEIDLPTVSVEEGIEQWKEKRFESCIYRFK